MAHKLYNTVEILVRFKIEVPFIATDENILESAETSTKLIVSKLGDALGELKKQYDITIGSDSE